MNAHYFPSWGLLLVEQLFSFKFDFIVILITFIILGR